MDGGVGGGGYRIEAERWLTISEKLLTARDFQGAKSFAIRARESDPRLLEFADQIIAVADTLLAGEVRVVSFNTGSNSHDYYAILQIPRLTQSMEVIATQYRKLALLLNPTRNRLSFADHAFNLVSEAWMVFSNPSKKTLYDHELQVSQLGQLGHQHQHLQQLGQLGVPSGSGSSSSHHQQEYHHQQDYHQFYHIQQEQQQPQQQQQQPNMVSFSESSRSTRQTQPRVTEPIRPIAQHKAAPEPSRPVSQPKSTTGSSRASAQPVAAAEPNRPVVLEKSPEPTRPAKQINNNAESSSRVTRSSTTESIVPGFWTACPYCFILYEYPKGYEDCAIRCQKCERAFHAAVIPSPPVADGDKYFCCWGYFPLGFSGSTKVIYKDDVYIDLFDSSEDDESDSDDADWGKSTKKVRNGKGKGTTGKNVKRAQMEKAKKVIVQNGDAGADSSVGGVNMQGEVARKGEGVAGRKRGAKDMGKLDLNVMFINEVEEAVPGVSESNGTGNEEEDNIEGTGFFEDLDEFFSTLPILVGDDKVKAS